MTSLWSVLEPAGGHPEEVRGREEHGELQAQSNQQAQPAADSPRGPGPRLLGLRMGATLAVRGRFLTVVRLIIAPFFCLAPPATLAVRMRFLTMVCLIMMSAFPSRLSWLLNSQGVESCGSGF